MRLCCRINMAGADSATIWDFELVLFSVVRGGATLSSNEATRRKQTGLFAERMKIPPQFSPLLTWKDPARPISD